MISFLTRHRSKLGYFAKNAPLAIYTSSLPGLVNYAVILFLSFGSSVADAGQYRLMMSCLALSGLLTVQESSKIVIRARAEGDDRSIGAIFALRSIFAAVALVLLLAVFAYDTTIGGGRIPVDIVLVAALAAVFYPTDIFIPYLQSERRFGRLAVWSTLKYALAFGVFVGLVWAGVSVRVASLVQIAAMLAVHLVVVAFVVGFATLKYRREPGAPSLFRRGDVRESLVLSLANLLPSSLEHVDKLVIGAFFGLETLGLYTLGFTTGRFVYNTLKPAFYIYYRHFVDNLPKTRLLWLVFASFTVFGALAAAGFWFLVDGVGMLAKLKGTEAVVTILFVSYGIAMVDAVYTQSYGINKNAKSVHLFVANVLICLVCLAMFAASTLTTAATAMIVCAMHYPVRHLGTIVILSALRRVSER
jgi:O-antigen/teichoic acid export membrane protein